jgi:hypothetical protein
VSFFLFSTPFSVFILQILLTVVSLVFCLAQKFTKAPPLNKKDMDNGIRAWCGLNEDKDSQWGFGQINAMILLATPLLFSIEAYFG